MSVSLLKTTVAPVAPVAPVEEAIDVNQLGDDILLASAAGEQFTTVAGRRAGWMQSHSSRAWTRGGNVD